MLGQRRRRGANVKTTLFRCIVFAGEQLPACENHKNNSCHKNCAKIYFLQHLKHLKQQ